MRNSTLTILTTVAVLLLAAGGVAAHGNDGDTTGPDASTNGSPADWTAWIEQHMSEHMGADAAEQMQDRMGMSSEEMGDHMASHQNGSMMGGMGCH